MKEYKPQNFNLNPLRDSVSNKKYSLTIIPFSSQKLTHLHLRYLRA